MTYETIEGGMVPIKAWVRGVPVEASALMQLREAASLPFVWPHLAVMPDVHWGMGATVGSVIPTRGAIVPAAVGVDIGCFTGDTLVPMLDGRDHRIEDLVGRDLFVWATTDSHRVVAATATAKRTRINAALARVTLDNGENVRCTPDHMFRLRDGSYCEAQALPAGASLMPFYSRKDEDGYTMIAQPYSGRWHRAHWIVARSGLLGAVPRFAGQKTVIHHKNFTESDNWPTNLQFMGDRDHSTYHRLLVERNEHWQSPEFEERRVAALRAKAATEDGHQYFAERGTKNIVKYMTERREHFLAAVAGNGERGRESLVAYNQSERGRAKSVEVAARVYMCPHCGESGRSGFFICNHINKCPKRHEAGLAPNNHRVVRVEHLEKREDVYCLTVPEHANFAISCGVFVHNCGMCAVKTPLTSASLGDSAQRLFEALSATIPHGRTDDGGPNDRGAWGEPPMDVRSEWEAIRDAYERDVGLDRPRERAPRQLGTLGTGNHFVEVCLDESDSVWIMLHSGSRGVGNAIGSHYIASAKRRCEADGVKLPNSDLAWLPEGTPEFDGYVRAVGWAQNYARRNREVMLRRAIEVLKPLGPDRDWAWLPDRAVNCHHNYVAREEHFGEQLWVTRKGAVSARVGEMGIIPGSMGTRSYIVRGKGNADSFDTCSHGAGRVMSRGAARKQITLAMHEADTAGVVCRKDADVVDESPRAYKDIDAVMAAQIDLVEVAHTLKQVVCVKG